MWVNKLNLGDENMIAKSGKKHYVSNKPLKRLYNTYDRYDSEILSPSSVKASDSFQYLCKEFKQLFN